MIRYLLILSLATFLPACTSDVQKSVRINTSDLQDSLEITTTHDRLLLAKVPPGLEKFNLSLEHPTYVKLISTKDNAEVLAYLEHNTSIRVLKRDKLLTIEDHKASEFLATMSQDQVAFIQTNASRIFGDNPPDSVRDIMLKFLRKQEESIMQISDSLSQKALAFLLNQNKNRIYSFLNYYGRISKNLEPDSDFFSFGADLNYSDEENKNLPHNILYQLEREFFTEHDSLRSIQNFLHHIDTSIEKESLSAFYKAHYLNQLMTSSNYWPRHEHLINTDEIKNATQKLEKDPFGSDYAFVYLTNLKDFYYVQEGLIAPNFTAHANNNESLNIDDLKGKVVFVDVWATWCAPCLEQRPEMLALIDSLESEPDFMGLMLSIDEKEDKWKKFVGQEPQYSSNNYLTDPSFLARYSIDAIPAYLLFNKKGRIASLSAPKPGTKEAYNIIYQELRK